MFGEEQVCLSLRLEIGVGESLLLLWKFTREIAFFFFYLERGRVLRIMSENLEPWELNGVPLSIVRSCINQKRDVS